MSAPSAEVVAPVAAAQPGSGAHPVAEAQRAEILDVLRGFALLGIFIAHVPGFSGWDALDPSARAVLDPGSDAVLQLLRETLVRGKFVSLFSLLFGIGFAIQQASATRRDLDFAARFRRRQLFLLALGLVHSAFWHGDILLTYALLGLLLIPTAQADPRRLLGGALACFALHGAWGLGTFALAGSLVSIGRSAVGDGAGGVDVMGTVGSVTAGYHSTDWGEMLLANARFLRMKWLLVLYDGRLFSIAAFFLLGVALGKWRLHESTRERRRALRRFAWTVGVLGLAGNVVLALLWSRVPVYPPTPLGLLTHLVSTVAVPLLALGMAAAMALIFLSRAGRRALSPLGPPGRMALSTYLSQTAIGMGVFYGVGLGARGTISLTEACGFAVLVFAAQAVLCHAWLRRYRYGPLEWGWRCVTYGRWLPFARDCGRNGRARE